MHHLCCESGSSLTDDPTKSMARSSAPQQVHLGRVAAGGPVAVHLGTAGCPTASPDSPKKSVTSSFLPTLQPECRDRMPRLGMR